MERSQRNVGPRTFPIIKRATRGPLAGSAMVILRYKERCIHLLKMLVPAVPVMQVVVFTGVDPTVDTTIACPPLQNQLAPS